MQKKMIPESPDAGSAHSATVTSQDRRSPAPMATSGGLAVDDPLLAYVGGRLGRDEAIRLLGLHNHAELLAALGEAGLSLPRPPAYEIEEEAVAFARVLKHRRASAASERSAAQAGVPSHLIMADSGLLYGLWMAGRLDLLLRLDMPVVIVDTVYDELTSAAQDHPGGAAVRAFIDRHQPPFIIETTDVGRAERQRHTAGLAMKHNAVRLAIADFMSSEAGLKRYLVSGDSVFLLADDPGYSIYNKPCHLYPLSTFSMLLGMEREGRIPSAEAVIRPMTQVGGS